MKVKESEKVSLKLNIQKTKIMEIVPSTSWQIDGETMETVRDFILGGGVPKSLQMVTAAMKLKDTCSWKKSYDQPRQHIKITGVTLPTKVHLVKVMVFPVVIYRCKSCTIKKAKCQRIDAAELWHCRRLLRVP